MASVIDVRALILLLRPDLRSSLAFDLTENLDRFVAWLVTSGLREYRALGEDPVFLEELRRRGGPDQLFLTGLQLAIWNARPDVRRNFPLPDKVRGFLSWFYTYGLTEHEYWYGLVDDEQKMILSLPEPWHSRVRTMIRRAQPSEEILPFASRPFGVNVIGYAYGQLGIGEDARMAARALLAVGLPMTMLNFPPGTDVPQNDRSMAEHVSQSGAFAFNFFCMTAEENGRYYAERGRLQFRDRYSIGYWPWELSKWPKDWEMMLDLVDEVWVSTQHSYDALAPVCSKPLLVMPMAVELGSVAEFASRKKARRHFGLAEKATLFCFSFDMNSSVHRKNPQACVDAFLAAFEKADFAAAAVGLVIKAHKPTLRNRAWEKLKRLAARDDRIRIIEATLPRPELLALYQACDCFVSLHRAEGFGRGLAEALQLGLHVITTGYSGNIDFCHAPHADLVDYRLINVRKGQYPHGEGQVWAEPDIAHAALLMRNFALGGRHKRRRTEWPGFAPVSVGQRYRARLEAIWQEQAKGVNPGNADACVRGGTSCSPSGK